MGKPLCTNSNCYDQPTADNLYNQKKKILKQWKLMTPASEFLAWSFLSCNNVKSNPRMPKSVHCGIPYVVNKNKTMIILPLCISLSHTWTIVFECFRWWISHNDKVWMLCCVLFNSPSFLTKLLSEKEDIFPLYTCSRRIKTKVIFLSGSTVGSFIFKKGVNGKIDYLKSVK